MYLKNFTLQVAAFNIRIFTEEDAYIYVPVGYLPFTSSEIYLKPDIEVKIKQGLPFDPQQGKSIFDANDTETSDCSQNLLWNIVEKDNMKLLFTSEPYKNEYPYLAADFLSKSDKWVIYNTESINFEGKVLLNPLAYPMGPLLLYHAALFNNAIMIHASGVAVNDEGYLFTGFSGRGKSTMAGIWQKNGFTVINDDRLLIRRIGEQYYIFNTPMSYNDIPKRVPLKAAFLIRHSPENIISEVKGTEKISRLMAFCIQHHYNANHVGIILNTVADISSGIDIYDLGFVPDDNIVNEILNLRNPHI